MTHLFAGWGGRRGLLLASLGWCAVGCTSRVEVPESTPPDSTLEAERPPEAVPPDSRAETQPPRQEPPRQEPPKQTPPEPPAGPVARAHLVSDINQVPVEASSRPLQFVKLGDALLFTARTPNEGYALWRWDAREGARMVKDLHPGQESSRFSALVALGAFVYFAAGPEGYNGQWALWRSDGTATGTRPVSGLMPPGPVSFFSFAHLADVPGRLLLTRQIDGVTELWSSDGTPEGSRRVWRVPELRYLSQPVLESQGALFIAVSTPCMENNDPDRPATCRAVSELWRVDATGQRLLWRGEENDEFTQLVRWRDLLVFSIENIASRRVSLWKMDEEGQRPERWLQLKPDATLARLTPTPGPLFFLSSANASPSTWAPHGLWASDGTAGGTVWLHDVQEDRPQRTALELTDLAVMGSTVYFESARTSSALPELWRTDGTPAGTRRVRAVPEERLDLLVHGRWLYFTESLPAKNCAWMRMEGETEQVERVKAFATGIPESITVLGEEFYFSANDGQGAEPWVSQGTAATTRQLQDVVPPQSDSEVRPLLVVGDTLYLSANDGLRGRELWSTDGSAAGTRLVHEFTPGPESTYLQQLFLFNSRLTVTQFETGLYGRGHSLWSFEGNPRAPRLVREHIQGGAMAVVGDTLYFTDERTEKSSWRIHHGLYALRDNTPAEELFSRVNWGPSGLTVLGDSLFFKAASTPDDVSWNEGLWVSRGTSGSPRLLTNQPFLIEGLVRMGAATYFKARDRSGSGNTLLWTLDEATGDTRVVSTGHGTLDIQGEPVPVGGQRLFFFARPASDDTYQRRELWVSDGTDAGTRRLLEFSAFALQRLTAVGDRVFFWHWEDVRGWGLWRSDGSEAGTTLVKTLTPALYSYGERAPVFVLPAGRGLVFAASDGASGMEVWWSDGTQKGTVLFTDLAAGPASSNPGDFTVMGDTLYFTADDQRTGRELWTVPLPAPPR